VKNVTGDKYTHLFHTRRYRNGSYMRRNIG